MKKHIIFLVSLIFITVSCTKGNEIISIKSPNKKITLEFKLCSAKLALYSVKLKDKLVISFSSLGLDFKNKPELIKDFKIIDYKILVLKKHGNLFGEKNLRF